MMQTTNFKNLPERMMLLGQDEDTDNYFVMLREAGENLALFTIADTEDDVERFNAQVLLQIIYYAWAMPTDNQKQYALSLEAIKQKFNTEKAAVGLQLPSQIKSWDTTKNDWV